MSVDAHAREARAERRWAARGRSPPARFLVWLARAHPWAWRVRLDLVVLFNAALALICVVLAQWVAPALVANTDNYSPDLAALILFVVTGLAALACAAAWAYAVTKSPRLREQPRHGGAPGPLLTCLVLLSFVFWAVAASAAPFVDLKRSPLYGDSIEGVLQERLTGSSESGLTRFAQVWGERLPSERVCAGAASGADAAGDASLCSLAATARRADLWRALTFRERYAQWRAQAAVYSRTLDQSAQVRAPRFLKTLQYRQVALQDEVIQFAAETEPWRARIAAMPPWQRREDVLHDPSLPAALARSHHFRRFIAEYTLFGALDALPQSLFESAFDESESRATPEDWDWTRRWQETVQRRLLASPAFARMFAEADKAILGQGAPPAVFSATAWADVAETHTRMFAAYHLIGNVEAAGAARLEGEGEARARWFAEWRARAADPSLREAFAASNQYDRWRRAFLSALVAEGAFDADLRALAPYRTVDDYWRQTIAQPAAAPEWRLNQALSGDIGAAAVIGFLAAIALTAFIVGVNHAGLAAAFGAFAANGVVALVGFIAGVTIVPAFAPVYDPARTQTGADWPEIWFWGFGCAAVLAPFVMAALALFRRVRRRATGFLAIFSIGACALWAPIGVFALWMQPAWSFWPSDLVQLLGYLAATFAAVIGFAWLASAMLTRIATLPRAR
jgi:hypothetical protein